MELGDAVEDALVLLHAGVGHSAINNQADATAVRLGAWLCLIGLAYLLLLLWGEMLDFIGLTPLLQEAWFVLSPMDAAATLLAGLAMFLFGDQFDFSRSQ